MSFFDLAAQNLLSPMVLFFVLGLAAALGRSDLTIPESIAKILALYLMMSIGFKGGAAVAQSGVSPAMLNLMAAGALLSFAIPFLAYGILRMVSKLSVVDAAAVSAHYGSISIVTFIAATTAVKALGIDYDGYLVAVAAVMETPAILAALLIVRRSKEMNSQDENEGLGTLLREVGLNGSVVMLVGSFFIGWITGEKGMAQISPFIVGPFLGFLCLFLLDMGLIAGRGMREGRKYLSFQVILFGIFMPLISAGIAVLALWPLGVSKGTAAVFITLAASASYIAVPAAMRLALPQARPSIYVTLSLGVTFPFNLALGIPMYIALAQAFFK
jgi:uncharacterized protein